MAGDTCIERWSGVQGAGPEGHDPKGGLMLACLRNVRNRYSFGENSKNILLVIASKPFSVTAHSGSVELPFIHNGQASAWPFFSLEDVMKAN
jgi:hypothetical protein